MNSENQYEEDGTGESSEELYEHHRLKADVGQEILRIDKFLMTRLPNVSRSRLQAIAKTGNLLVNGKPVTHCNLQ
ncbi:MAG: hypothetical protein MI810_08395 [Flavobacteriales bacterium]|nr:hypothetical protein [Flavobacteriales bacterium]